jgi:hypothetical protein
MNGKFTSNRQRLLAERVASYGAEQRRLKDAAASRRAAAALRAAREETDHNLSARPQRLPAAAGRSQYLR